MNQPPTQTAALPLGAATLAAMQRATRAALPPRPGTTEAEQAAQRDGALVFLAT